MVEKVKGMTIQFKSPKNLIIFLIDSTYSSIPIMNKNKFQIDPVDSFTPNSDKETSVNFKLP